MEDLTERTVTLLLDVALAAGESMTAWAAVRVVPRHSDEETQAYLRSRDADTELVSALDALREHLCGGEGEA